MSEKISTITKMWIGLAVLAILSPIGIILPDKFNAGSAWGEWSADEISKMVGYVPQGMEKLADIWSAPMPDYAFKGWDSMGLGMLSLGYILSAVIGIAVIGVATLIIGKVLKPKEE
jgi:cobalt/nickel transport protein